MAITVGLWTGLVLDPATDAFAQSLSAPIGESSQQAGEGRGERVNIRDFGAQPGADIAPAIEKAVEHLRQHGGGTLDFSGIQAKVSRAITLNGVSNIVFSGKRARLTKLPRVPNNCTIFHIRGGSIGVSIEDFSSLDGGCQGGAGPMASNDPVILIGDIVSNSSTAANRNISVLRNTISYSFWGGIVVYGRAGSNGSPAPLNQTIRVSGNTITNSSNGVFVYKNARDIEVTDNRIVHSGYDGIVFDTHAATDRGSTEPIEDIRVTGNVVDTFGSYGYGVGILLKGEVNRARVLGNRIQNGSVNRGGVFNNYGILLTNDTGRRRGANDVLIEQNVISNIRSSRPNGGFGINVNGQAKRIRILRNQVSQTTNRSLVTNLPAAEIEVRQNSLGQIAKP